MIGAVGYDDKRNGKVTLPISKRMVYNSYLKGVANAGSAGIDQQSIEQFNESMSGNLYKIWNRMTSGSYFPPPVPTVLIPWGSKAAHDHWAFPRSATAPAQGVVKDYLEPTLETIFHPGSFGYRPGKSAHDALQQCQENCIQYGWVLDVDIKGFLDNLSHERMMQLLQQHTGKMGAAVCRALAQSRGGTGRQKHLAENKRHSAGWCYLPAAGQPLSASRL
ncbi:MAG: hypothetical protein ICV79_11105 [Flavisolibacter sp.]|nr:hypothetical protein [Flavisolibacter sp.]